MSETVMAVAGLLNFRDVGGLPVRGGGRTRFSTLYRSHSPHGLGPAGMDDLRALGLRAMLDLRDASEIERWPYDLGDPAVEWINVPVLSELPVPHDQAGLYRHMVYAGAPGLTRAVQVLARAASQPILVHCAVGKDRTGLAVGLALSAAGVPDEAVVQDFLRSNVGLNIPVPADGEVVEPEMDGDGYKTHRYVRAALMENSLQYARELGGDVPGYLAMHGMTDAELDSLRASLVDPAAE